MGEAPKAYSPARPRRAKRFYPNDRYRVTVIIRPEHDHPFQLRIVDRLTRSVERRVGRANPDRWARDFRAKVKEACRAEGLPEVGPHDLRRTFATLLARRGLDPLALKTVMRHSRIETTERFYVDMDREQAATRALNLLGKDDEMAGNDAKPMSSTPDHKSQGKV